MKRYEGPSAQMDLTRLNPPQRQAVTTTEGPVLVLAGAGSGKTRVITHRIVHLLDRSVPGRAILAVTFTNKAALEMKERVVRMAGSTARAVTISTFHAFGAEMLREEIPRLGFPKRFAIADMGDQLSLVKRAMRERQVDDRSFDARRVLTLISKAKNSGRVPEPKPEGMGDDYDLITHLVYPLYQLALRETNGETCAVDADLAAAQIAVALAAHKLIYLTDAAGILEHGELVTELAAADLDRALETRVSTRAIVDALRGGVARVHVIDGRTPHSLIAELFTDRGVGTLVTLGR